MLRFLPILLLVLQALPFAAPVEAADGIQTPQKMACCGGCCKCAANGCQCSKKQNNPPAPSKTPFSITSIDFALPLATAQYQLPQVTSTGELACIPTTTTVVSSNNCRQALLGRWQN
ncbi:MAG: hypothetical protein H8E83_08560 [Planctomycetes bacterium]|nr:hypothetical protein [Planctomycetota bacterium]